jgi:hypothetical protein
VNGALVDASALVALLDADDANHPACVEALKRVRGSLLTVWPALTEAMHLLADTPPGVETLCDMVDDGALELIEIPSADLGQVKALMAKYRDLPMDFADAVLVRAAERTGLHRIVTFDHHFGVYRLPGRKRFVTIPAGGRVGRP